jgi:uncharacterized repeat protein (TIGR01451 family)
MFMLLVVMLVWVASPVMAADPVEAKLTARKVMVDKKGRESFQSATKATPGDTLEYSVTYKNKGSETVSDFVATLPIPVGMIYVDKSAYPKQVEASTDGQEFYPVPLVRDVKTKKILLPNEANKSGVVKESVPLIEYRVLRWQFPQIKRKSSVVTRARASIIAPAEQ